jgi:hypothetical protein
MGKIALFVGGSHRVRAQPVTLNQRFAKRAHRAAEIAEFKGPF